MISKYQQEVKLQSFLADRCTDSQIIQINVTEAQILFDQWCGTEVGKKVVCWDRWNFNAKSSQKCPFVHYELFINSFAQSFHKRRNSAVHERLLPKFILLKMCFPISIVAAFPWNYFVSFFSFTLMFGMSRKFWLFIHFDTLNALSTSILQALNVFLLASTCSLPKRKPNQGHY